MPESYTTDTPAVKQGIKPLTGDVRLKCLHIVGERDGWHCHYCSLRLSTSEEQSFYNMVATLRAHGLDHPAVPAHIPTPSIDHKVPVSKGGDHSPANLVLACTACNTRKSNRFTYEEFLVMNHMGADR